MNIPCQPSVLKRIARMGVTPKEIGKLLGLKERQSYRLVKSYAKKDRAAVTYILDQIEKAKEEGAGI